ncbi:hypothetical protein [Anaeromyxobacter terrae]|uniref:hypothetical protein n=1 Tax=Anaeromyxobacter terrae TaxID=2925406 RepID=UPI001F5851AB|nr:hypothetical protein [Anaeromyxobacter sp. SG22]
MRPRVTWQTLASCLLNYTIVVLGGALAALVLMRECADGWAAVFVGVTALVAFVGGLTALLRGAPPRSVRLAVGVTAIGAYLLAVWWCNRWTSDDERALRDWQEKHSAPEQRKP